MHNDDKSVFVFQPACLCPNSHEHNDARYMRMTDKETRHAPNEHRASSKIGTLLKNRHKSVTDLIGFDRVRTTHSAWVPFHGLRSLHLSMWVHAFRVTFLIASSWSSSTIERTPPRNSRSIVFLFPCLFVKASTTIRSCGTHLHLALSVCMLLRISHDSCAVRLQ